LLEIFLPKEILRWFDIKKINNNEKKIEIVFEEKNIVPEVPQKHKGKKITAKSFKRILVDDFPIRGKKAELIFLRRRWQVKGEKELLKRDIQLVVPGTTLVKEFADFLKELSRE
jgi:hypothetical protein